MSYPTFNGWTIINPPATPVIKQIDFDITDAVANNQSPYSMQTQMQVWPGAESMVWNVSLPPMKTTTAIPWVAWFRQLQGILNVFQLGDPNHPVALGTVSGTPVVDSSSISYNLPATTTLYTRGWTPSAAGVLLEGDYIQIGYRLYSVLQNVTADTNGKAQINIWPSLRELPADGTTIITSNTKGLFRLVENKRSWSERENKMVGIAWKCVEAR